MNTQTVIPLRKVCRFFQIELEIVQDFAEFGLYPTVPCNNEVGIEPQYLDKLKRIISLYQALGINKEGIEVILELREKNFALQRDVELLKNKVEKLEYYLGNEESGRLKQRSLLIEVRG
jgi:chaperone modulatory protein CbpM